MIACIGPLSEELYVLACVKEEVKCSVSKYGEDVHLWWKKIMALNSEDTFDWTNLLGEIRQLVDQLDETVLVTKVEKWQSGRGVCVCSVSAIAIVKR